jgi:PIN domain nuclease of toxin-antitoxin system
LLLDTHAALWAIGEDERLPPTIRTMSADPQNEVWVSAVSVWEIAIKHGLARGRPNDTPLSGAETLAFFGRAGYWLLSITPEHAAAVETLPRLHGDPFDRLLLAQAAAESLRLICHDAAIAAYGEPVISF